MYILQKHRTPRYVFDRSRVWLWSFRNPNAPWLTPEAVRFLEQTVRAQDDVFEWGAGRSTIWFAERARRVVSVEHDASWHAHVVQETRGFSDVECHHVAVRDGATAAEDEYVGAIEKWADPQFDVILIDGLVRDRCAVAAVPRLRPGGLLVVDNVERYIPSASRSPVARGPHDGFSSPAWAEFCRQVEGWRRFWTSSGVTDTAIWIRG